MLYGIAAQYFTVRMLFASQYSTACYMVLRHNILLWECCVCVTVFHSVLYGVAAQYFTVRMLCLRHSISQCAMRHSFFMSHLSSIFLTTSCGHEVTVIRRLVCFFHCVTPFIDVHSAFKLFVWSAVKKKRYMSCTL